MKGKKLVVILVAAFFCFPGLSGPNLPDPPAATSVGHPAAARLAPSAVCFIENKGQFEASVRYLAQAPWGNILLAGGGITFQFVALADLEGGTKSGESPVAWAAERTARVDDILLVFKGARPDPIVEPLDSTPAAFNFLYGSDPGGWVTGARAYRKIVYHDLYPAIDLMVLSTESGVKCEYRVKPGGRVEDIRIDYDGAVTARVNAQGQVEVAAENGFVVEDEPLSYQLVDGEKKGVKTAFAVGPGGELGFRTGPYRRDIELVIDPSLMFSTFLGGSGQEVDGGIAVDPAGNVYVTGQTYSGNFPKSLKAYDRTFNGVTDIFVTKFKPDGSGLVYSTFLGGNGGEAGSGIAVDAAGQAFVCGTTQSPNFPTTIGAFDRTLGGVRDAFLVKLNAAGTALVYSTLIGGSGSDESAGLSLSPNGTVCLTGSTLSADFPTTVNAYDKSLNGGRDAFALRVNSTGKSLVFSTFFGGSGEEQGLGIILDAASNVFITGTTTSANLPTTVGAYDRSLGGPQDVFVSRFNAQGNGLVFSTYLGSSGLDGTLGGIAVDSGGNVYLTGFTESNRYPITAGAWDSAFSGSNEAFLTKLNPAGAALVYSTFLGGSNQEFGRSVGVDVSGEAVVTGTTKSANWPVTRDAYDQTHNGDQDIFLTWLDPAGRGLLYSTFIGGSGADRTSGGLALDVYGNAFVIGSTGSPNFPRTAGAFDRTYAGARDDAVLKFSLPVPVLVVDGHDFNGNYSSDPAVFRPTSGSWLIQNTGTYQLGAYGDIPANGDYNGDFMTEPAVYRPSDGTWLIGAASPVPWGAPGDIPVPRNYFGTWATDIAVWRPADGTWFIKGFDDILWGQAGDYPVPGDYNSDGYDEIAVWRPSTGTWLIRGVGTYQWGSAGDVPVPGDYNGDFRTDLAVWRPSTGTWSIKFLGGWTRTIQWGQRGDFPVPADYNGDGVVEPAVWRPGSGTWSIYGGATFQWGQAGDIPVVR